MIFICSLIFLFLIKIRFPKGVSISEILTKMIFYVAKCVFFVGQEREGSHSPNSTSSDSSCLGPNPMIWASKSASSGIASNVCSSKTQTAKYSVNFPISNKLTFKGRGKKDRKQSSGGKCGKGRGKSSAGKTKIIGIINHRAPLGDPCVMEDILDYNLGGGKKMRRTSDGESSIESEGSENREDDVLVCRICGFKTHYELVFKRHAPSHHKINGIIK